MREHVAAYQGMIELQSVAEDACLAPVAGVGNQGVLHGPLLAQLKPRVGRHSRLIAAAEAVGAQRVGTEQGDHHGAVGDEVAGQADIEQGEPAAAVAVVDPVLRGELDGGGSVDRSERDLVRALALLDRRREKRLVADILLLVDQPAS